MPRGRKPALARDEPVYGDVAAREESVAAVPMAQAPAPVAAPPAMPLVPLDAESQYPEEPLTSGLPVGPGPGPEVLGFGAGAPDTDRLRRMLPTLELMASQRGSSQALRQLVRTIRGGVQ